MADHSSAVVVDEEQGSELIPAEAAESNAQEAPVEESLVAAAEIEGKQPKYSEEFKQAAVARIQAGESQAAVSRDTGVKPPTLRKWLSKSAEGEGSPETTSDDTAAIDRELLAKLEAGKSHPNAKARSAIEKCLNVLRAIDEAQKEASEKAKREEEYQAELQTLKTKYGKK